MLLGGNLCHASWRGHLYENIIGPAPSLILRSICSKNAAALPLTVIRTSGTLTSRSIRSSTLIRNNADDELTYILRILIRYEVEEGSDPRNAVPVRTRV